MTKPIVYNNRWQFIAPYVQNRRVLDIGVAELVGTTNRAKMDRWIHKRISGVARELVGLEQSAEQVAALSKLGYDIRIGDAEDFNLNCEFDVVVAGELIEHLSNPGRFLDCVKRHLADGATIVLTTPNRFSIRALSHVVLRGRVSAYQKEIAKHVIYFDSEGLRFLLERHGFRDVQTSYCKWVGKPGGLKWRMVIGLLSKIRPALLPTLVVSAKK